jgi:glycosyltransferase involved in cell wall biosynthesis
MMHICLVHRDLHQVTRGGICTLYRALAGRLLDRGHQVTLVTQETPHPVRLNGVRCLALPRTGDLTAHRERVARVLDAVSPQVVDCSTWEAEALAYLRQPRRVRAPVLVRGDLSAATMGASRHRQAEHELLHLADQVIAVSRFAARDLAQAYGVPEPLVVPNGVDRALFMPGPVTLPRSGHRVALGAGGQVVGRSPLAPLIQAGGNVAPWHPDPRGRARLVWVGKVTAMKGWDRLERLIPRLRHLASLTILLGHSPAYSLFHGGALEGQATVLQDLADDDMPSFYRAADYLLCTSQSEGFGLAIAEALACGTPVLAPARLGTAPELITAGAGWLYQDEADLTRLLASRPRLCGRLPSWADWDANADSSLRLYQHLASAGRKIGLPCASW